MLRRGTAATIGGCRIQHRVPTLPASLPKTLLGAWGMCVARLWQTSHDMIMALCACSSSKQVRTQARAAKVV